MPRECRYVRAVVTETRVSWGWDATRPGFHGVLSRIRIRP